MPIEFFGDADAYLKLGADCARAIEGGSLQGCYNGLRPVGAILYFALAPLLSSDPVTVLYIQVALNVATFLLLLRGMMLCVPEETAGQGPVAVNLSRAGLLAGALALAMPYLPVPLSDLPAVAFFIWGLALFMRPQTSLAGMVVAGISMALGCLIKQNYFPFTAFAFMALAVGPMSPRSRADWIRVGAAAAGAAVALLQPALVWMRTRHFWPYEPAEGEVFDAVRLRNVVELVAFTIPAKSAYLSTLDSMALSPLSHFCIKLLQGFFAFRPAVYLGAAPVDSPVVLPLTKLLLTKAYLGAAAIVAGHVLAAAKSPRNWRPVVVLSLAATLFSAWIIHVENRYFLLPKLLIVWWTFGWAVPAGLRRFAASATAAGVWHQPRGLVATTPVGAVWRPSSATLLAYAAVLVACFFLFLQPDLLHTVGSSYAYLQGHWKDFYDYNQPLARRNDYLPAIYAVFAAWYLPLHLLGALTDVAARGGVTFLHAWEPFWGKLLLALLFFATAALLARVAILASGRRDAGWRAAAVFATAPLAVFPVFVMGQYDVVPVLLVVAALLAYVERRFVLFAVLFSLAIPFKYFAVAFFGPLLLLAPVSWWRRVQLGAIALAGTALQVALYWHSAVFRHGLLRAPMEQGTSAVALAVAAAGCLAICVACALSGTLPDRQWHRRAVLSCALTAAFLFIGVDWHPQWLLFAMPFFALASIDMRRPALWYGIEVVMAIAFGWLLANLFPGNVDAAMAQQGALGQLFPVLYLRTADLMGQAAVPAMQWLFSAALFAPAVLMWLDGGALAVPERRREADAWVPGRFHAGLAIVLVPMLYCMSATEAQGVDARSQARFAVLPRSLSIAQLTRTPGELLEGRTVEQEVVASRDGLSAIAVRFATYGRVNSGNVRISVHDASGAELAVHTVPAARLKDNHFYAFSIPPQAKSAGRSYVVTISTSEAQAGSAPTVWIDGDPPPEATRLRVDGKAERGALNLQLLDAAH